MSEKIIYPHYWKILRINTNDDCLYKVLASWQDCFRWGNSWKLNSGIVGMVEDDQWYTFKGYSGSLYRCHKASYGITDFGGVVLDAWKKKIDIDILNYEDFLCLIKDKHKWELNE